MGRDASWERVQEIFLQVADLRPDERAPFLDAACGGDGELRQEVESLLREDATAETVLITAIRNAAASVVAEHLLAGVRLGPYRIVEEIGRGGMGSVYLAERDDDEFRKFVAIKVVKRGMDTDEVLQRFRHERQILAGLEHPYIARLIDGGTTPDGRPFLVMEKVEGQPLDTYCASRRLGIEERLRLFMRVCDAVSHAHRALVVHRDLKPSNILVTDDGLPKLLDFGIAKLLDGGGGARLTRTIYGAGPITPEYASPEQVRGLPVTTATDVYALGAILFELLTGTRAQRMETHTPAEIDRVVCETKCPKPSSLVKGLDSDLDVIVLKAMQKERERRYASVDRLANDIQLYVDGLPITARLDSFAYRSGKFVRRHRLALAALAVVFGTLVGAVGVSLHEARQAVVARRIAEIDRQMALKERSRAEAETAVAKREADRADRRLAQLVELADRSLYDVHSAIEKLPGATEARKQIVATTLQFLENLSKDAGQDDRLRFALSAAYLKVADVQGYPLRPNLGDTAGALASYSKAIALIEPLAARNPDHAGYQLRKLTAQMNRAQLQVRTGDLRPINLLEREILPAAQRLAAQHPQDPSCVIAEAEVYSVLADCLRSVDADVALTYARRQSEALERDLKTLPDNREIQLHLASAYSQEAANWNRHDELERAGERYKRAISLRLRLLRKDPTDVLTRRQLMITYGNMGGNLGSPFYPNLGDTAGAREAYGKALAIARDLANADANDQLAQYDLANALLFYASLETPREEWEQSLKLLTEADGVLQKLTTADPQSVLKLMTLAMVREYEGHRLEGLGKLDEAIAEYRQSLALAEKGLARTPSSTAFLAQAFAGQLALAKALARQGRHNEALALAQKAVERAERVVASPAERSRVKRYVSMAYGALAEVRASSADWAGVRSAAQRSVEGWRQLAESGSRLVIYSEAQQSENLLREAEKHFP